MPNQIKTSSIVYSESFSYVWVASCKPSCCSKDFIHRCLHKWFGHPQLFCSSVDLIPVAGLGAHKCGLSSRVMWSKSSVLRTYKNCHMLPKRSFFYVLFFKFQAKQVAFTLGPQCYTDHKLLLWQLHSTHMRNILAGFLQWFPYITTNIYFPLFALLNTGLICLVCF